MLDGYMEENVGKYCTFEDNYFASEEYSRELQQQSGYNEPSTSMDDTTFMDGNKAAFAMIKPSADESTEITTKPLVTETAVAATETRSNSGVKSWFNRILKKGDADKAGDK